MSPLLIVILFVIVSVLNVSSQIGSSVWLSHWSNQRSISKNNVTSTSKSYYLFMFMAFDLSNCLIEFLSSYIFIKITMIACRKYHKNIFSSLIHSTMEFFETTSLKFIVDGFTSDMNTIDNKIPADLQPIIFNLTKTVSILLTIGIELKLCIIFFLFYR